MSTAERGEKLMIREGEILTCGSGSSGAIVKGIGRWSEMAVGEEMRRESGESTRIEKGKGKGKEEEKGIGKEKRRGKEKKRGQEKRRGKEKRKEIEKETAREMAKQNERGSGSEKEIGRGGMKENLEETLTGDGRWIGTEVITIETMMMTGAGVCCVLSEIMLAARLL